MKVLATKVDEETNEMFKQHCVDCGKTPSERLRELVEDSFEDKPEAKGVLDDDKHPYHDNHGNYWTWNKEGNIWTCHLNEKNVTIRP